MRLGRAVDLLFLAALFTATFAQLERAEVGLKLFDLLGAMFVVTFAVERLSKRDLELRPPEMAVLLAATALLAVYLAAAPGLETHWSRVQFAKGLGKFVIHIAVLATAVAYLTRRPPRFYLLGLAAFCAGIGVNAAYGAAQLAAAKAGINLDEHLLEPLTGRPARTLTYSQSFGPNVERARGLTTDPNHLGIMLLVPLLVILPLSVRAQSRVVRRALTLCFAVLLVVGAATLSRSALVGFAAGLAVLVWRYRTRLFSRGLLATGGILTACLAFVVAREPNLYSRLFSARTGARTQGQPGHLEVYDFVPRALESHPLVGIGLNNFAPFAYPVTGRRDYGPLSVYVQTLVETGLVGAVVYFAFLGYCAWRLRAAHGLVTPQVQSGPVSDGLVWGLAAVLVGTMAANAFYLTMTFAYFYCLLAFVLMAPAALPRRLELGEGLPEKLGHASGGVLAGHVLAPTVAHREQA